MHHVAVDDHAWRAHHAVTHDVLDCFHLIQVDCDALCATPAKDREKAIKESTGRGQLPTAVKRGLTEGKTAEDYF